MTNDLKQSAPAEAHVRAECEGGQMAVGQCGVLPRLRSEDLLQGGKELEIEHGAAVYRLRLTAMGRLILTK